MSDANLINWGNVPSWSWKLNNPQNAFIDQTVLSPKGTATVRLDKGVIRELELIGIAVKPNDVIDMLVQCKLSPSTAQFGALIGMDFYTAGQAARICGLNLNKGGNIFYGKDNTVLNGAAGAPWADQYFIPWGSDWTLAQINFTVPPMLESDGGFSNVKNLPIHTFGVPAWIYPFIGAAPTNGGGDHAWFGDPLLLINGGAVVGQPTAPTYTLYFTASTPQGVMVPNIPIGLTGNNGWHASGVTPFTIAVPAGTYQAIATDPDSSIHTQNITVTNQNQNWNFTLDSTAPTPTPYPTAYILTQLGYDIATIDLVRTFAHSILPQPVIDLYHTNGTAMANYLANNPTAATQAKQLIDLFIIYLKGTIP